MYTRLNMVRKVLDPHAELGATCNRTWNNVGGVCPMGRLLRLSHGTDVGKCERLVFSSALNI
jgi:hypothetical protein